MTKEPPADIKNGKTHTYKSNEKSYKEKDILFLTGLNANIYHGRSSALVIEEIVVLMAFQTLIVSGEKFSWLHYSLNLNTL